MATNKIKPIASNSILNEIELASKIAKEKNAGSGVANDSGIVKNVVEDKKNGSGETSNIGKMSYSSTPQANAINPAITNFAYGQYNPSVNVNALYNAMNANSIYNPSASVTQAQNAMNAALASKPADWNGGAYKAGLDDVLNRIMNREKFSYDLNGDALYQQYKDRYISQGQQAMADAIGQAQAMTGGYGNSYAQTVGNQAYQGYLQGLNDKIPELYQMALDRYNAEGNDLKDQYSMLNNQYQNEYNAYRDQVADWNNDVNRATDRYYNESNMDYNRFADNRDFSANAYNNERNFDYGLYSDDYNRAFNEYQQNVDERQFADKMLYQQERDKISDAFNEREFQFAVDKANAANLLSEKELQLARDKFNAANDQWSKEYNLNLINAQKKAEEEQKKNGFNYDDTTPNIKRFEASILRPHEALGGNHEFRYNKEVYTDYNEYALAVIKDWHKKGDLSDDEVSTLIAKMHL